MNTSSIILVFALLSPFFLLPRSASTQKSSAHTLTSAPFTHAQHCQQVGGYYIIVLALLSCTDMTPTLQAASTKEILSALPEANKKTLYFMCCHLHRVSLSASSNKMNSSNLAIVFWPTLMRPSLDDLVDQGKHLCWQVVMNQMINDPELVPH